MVKGSPLHYSHDTSMTRQKPRIQPSRGVWICDDKGEVIKKFKVAVAVKELFILNNNVDF